MTTLVETYKEMKDRHSQEFSKFIKGNVFFAFSEKQFEEGMKSVGLENIKENYSKLLKINGGGFLLKSKEQEWDNISDRIEEEEKQAITNDTDGTGFIKQMFEYEMGNHEYAYTGDISSTLDALGLTWDEIVSSESLLNGFKIAKKEVIDYYNNCD